MVTRSATLSGLLALLMLGMLVLGLTASPALATEGEETHFTEYEDIRENASDISTAFLDPDAEESERPGFFDWMIYPLAGIGVLITGFILFQYLVFQPRFAREADARSQR